MDEADIVTFCYARASWNKTKPITKAFERAAQYMLGYTGQGGGTVYHFDGRMVRHDTENAGECTVFFTFDSGICSIVGIGEHTGKSKDTAKYKLAWHSKKWVIRKSDGLLTKEVDLNTYHDHDVTMRAQSVRPKVLRRG
jgi:hypothetical protein